MGKVVSAVKWTAIDNTLMNLFSLVVFFILARLLNVESFGFINLANFIILFLSLLVVSGFQVALIQKKDLTEIDINSVLIIVLLLGLAFSALLFFSASLIALLFAQPELEGILKFMSPILIFKSVSVVPDALLQRELNFKALAKRNVLSYLISGIVSISLAYMGFGYMSLVWQQILIPLIGMILLWASIKWRPNFRFSFDVVKSLFQYARLILVTEFLSVFNREGLRIFIGYFLGPVALGYYSMAGRITNLTVKLLTVTLSKVALPYFSKIQDDIPNVRIQFYKFTSLSSAVIFPIIASLIVFSEEIIPLVFGAKWMNSIVLLQILLFGSFVHSLSYFNGSVITALGKAKWRMNLAILRLALGVVLFYIGVQYSIELTIIMFVARIYLVEPIQFVLAGKLIAVNWKHYFGNILIPLCISVGVALLTFILKNHISVDGVISKLLLLIAEVIVFYLFYVVLLNEFARSTFLALKGQLFSFKKK